MALWFKSGIWEKKLLSVLFPFAFYECNTEGRITVMEKYPQPWLERVLENNSSFLQWRIIYLFWRVLNPEDILHMEKPGSFLMKKRRLCSYKNMNGHSPIFIRLPTAVWYLSWESTQNKTFRAVRKQRISMHVWFLEESEIWSPMKLLVTLNNGDRWIERIAWKLSGNYFYYYFWAFQSGWISVWSEDWMLRETVENCEHEWGCIMPICVLFGHAAWTLFQGKCVLNGMQFQTLRIFRQ